MNRTKKRGINRTKKNNVALTYGKCYDKFRYMSMYKRNLLRS